MFPIVISSLQAADEVEVVERKGIGHPDTICDALRPKSPDDNIAICAIPITNNISRRFLPAECFGELTGDPFGTRM
jgi:hypothetical protein